MSEPSLLTLTDRGLYCEAGDFHVDPWRPVERAVLTHAHADHAIPGCGRYLAARAGEHVLRVRLGSEATIEAVDYGQAVTLGRVRVSLHPAGHILGSAQVRMEHHGEVWAVSGDYKLEPDPTCTPFEPVRCQTFVTESTFGLPVYRWPAPAETFAEIHAWWRANRDAGRASLLYGYALGKAQRLLAGLDPSLGPIFTHGAVAALVPAYQAAGIAMPPTAHVGARPAGAGWAGALVVAPPSAHGTPWARRFGPASSALASGWMRVRGARRRRAVDRGFVLSDHADWPGLLEAIAATGAAHVWVTHGSAASLARWLVERGLDARTVATRFEGERDELAGPEENPAPQEPE
ncbi:MAG TPA: ligase-associated DNA damage response exonuclease [Isosphaeraceae bacterium]